jgi:hydrophobic/amphiphilic exporter-1 (mainly G- bacteria), HAE1 family
VGNLNKFLAAARKRPEIGTIATTYIPSTPQKFVYVDKEKVLKQGVNLSNVYSTLQSFMGGQFVNYFNQYGRTWQVYVASEAPYRANLDNVGQFYVRNKNGEMVPLSALTRFESRYGPEFRRGRSSGCGSCSSFSSLPHFMKAGRSHSAFC